MKECNLVKRSVILIVTLGLAMIAYIILSNDDAPFMCSIYVLFICHIKFS